MQNEEQLLEDIFRELNAAHFRAQLPLPTLKWNTRLSSTAGRFCPGSRFLLRERPPEIEVATYLRDLPDGRMHVRDTVLHEMIHYFLWHVRRPHGHTAEFHEIMRRVGAKRYNTVPKLRPMKYLYECPGCRKRVPTRRRLGVSACATCCNKFNRGQYHERFRLHVVKENPALEECVAHAPEKQNTEPEERIPPHELIRRLEELKLRLKNKPS